MANSRRESFAVNSAIFSPKTEDWHSVDMQSVPSNNPFVDQQSNTSNNPFIRLDQNQQHHVFGQQQGGGWLMGHGSGSGSGTATPFPAFDHVATAEYDPGTSIFQRQMQSQTPFSNPGNLFGPLGQADQSMPASPSKEWMAASQSVNKKMRPGSPVIRSHNDMRRGDGIRKKNARFEIPAERNLSNIDQLIAQSTDEQEVKELKQQKRLLRNRQAALDSRQRKKQHTERLEDEKKHYSTLVTGLEEEISDLKAKMDQLLREKQSYTDYIETVTLEKDEMIRAHTIETGELRKKVSVLTEHVQRLESSPMVPAVSQVNPFGGTYDDMGDMAMAEAWDSSGYLNDFADPPVKQQMTVVPVKKSETTIVVDGDKGASQGGLLFMLFLVGAFVMSSRSTPAIPRVSEDVRAASATLLDNVLKDAGVGSQSHPLQPMAPQPSGTSWSQPAPGGSMPGMGVSMLEELGDSLTQPTEEQTNEQIFSLSAAQYNGVNSQEFLQHSPQRSTSHGRRNLAEALATMRATDKQTGAADVYTRSLLWDQIPSEVVRNFAKMVAECSNAQNEHQRSETT
ncbi:bZIP transcription factor [Ophiocordyceps sinensis CO18]|nr:bZIP transcription factor [Ophiocordyceps sinensis CO18]